MLISSVLPAQPVRAGGHPGTLLSLFGHVAATHRPGPFAGFAWTHGSGAIRLFPAAGLVWRWRGNRRGGDGLWGRNRRGGDGLLDRDCRGRRWIRQHAQVGQMHGDGDATAGDDIGFRAVGGQHLHNFTLVQRAPRHGKTSPHFLESVSFQHDGIPGAGRDLPNKEANDQQDQPKRFHHPVLTNFSRRIKAETTRLPLMNGIGRLLSWPFRPFRLVSCELFP